MLMLHSGGLRSPEKLMKARLITALSLTVEFFGLRSIVVGSLPVVFWILKQFFYRTALITANFIMLFATYVVVGFAVFVWKLAEAKVVIATEKQYQGMLNKLSLEGRESLNALWV
jgi:hypothetical protein